MTASPIHLPIQFNQLLDIVKELPPIEKEGLFHFLLKFRTKDGDAKTQDELSSSSSDFWLTPEEEKSKSDSPYWLAHSVLAKDWDSPADDHWDNL